MIKRIVFLLVCIALILTTNSVLAQQKMISVENYEIINAKPGEKVESSIKVKNRSEKNSTEIEIWLQDWKTTVEDKQVIKKPVEGAGTLEHSLAPYLTLQSPDKITLSPNETKEVVFTTEVPKDKKGTYWTAVVVAQYLDQDQEKKEAKENEIKVRTKIAWFSKVIRSNEENENLKPWIGFLSKPKVVNVEDEENKQVFEATLENQGEVAFFYPCRLTIYEGLDKDNNKIVKKEGREAIAEIAPFYLFPKNDLELEVDLPFRLEPGLYTAKLKILMKRGEYAPVAWREFRIKE